MYTITFYSFKGGVGRTMALVNTAAELARRGRKVLLVDFDLEAPGLSTYKLLRPSKPHPGMVEYVTDFRQTRRAPLVTDFIYEAQPVGKTDGRLWVMPAGRGDADYRRKLNALDWRKLYADEEGFLLFEDTRLQWESELHPDYVLIDARTGHTDIEGICTRQLADAVVVVFYPNEQNLAGLREVCQHIRAEQTSGLKKNIKLHFVASNVPDLDDEDRHLQRHMKQFRKQLEIGPSAPPIPIIHRNETYQMLEQPIFVLKRPRSRLAREYRFLTRSLQMENRHDRDGVLLFLRELQKARSRFIDIYEYGKPGWYLASTENALNQITALFWDDAELMFRAGECLLGYMEPDKALVRLNRALVLRPQFAEALFVRGFCHRQRCQDAAAAEDLLEYLRQQGAQLPVNETNGKVKRAEHLEKGVTNEQNEKALLEVFSISLDAFLKTLELPPVEIPIVGTSHGVNWLGRIILRLIQQRRWDDALRCLEHPKVKASGNHAFYRAIAHWGKRGEPCRDLCSQALRAYMPWLGESFNEESGDFQNPPEDVSSLFDITLLCWGAGDISAAEVALKQTLACLDFIEQVGASLLFDTSSWSFQETTRHQFRRDCEDLARMIRGEPVRPAFLAPLTAP